MEEFAQCGDCSRGKLWGVYLWFPGGMGKYRKRVGCWDARSPPSTAFARENCRQMHRRSGTEELLLWWEVKPNATPSATLPKNKECELVGIKQPRNEEK
ncbi:hypothetical protein TNCT_430651 [Trichonephila clavata]|uniref:Uncharacterized protein n=1 Tax=Trichonephila clavata TaxID=2740835 RepID=A0A8X6KAA7_TRICU|nr:hypothetical protein TNCT_430651 [Trichonephila clavata]